MITVPSEVVVSTPPERVFAYLSDPHNQAEWTPNFLELIEEPDRSPGVGMRYRGRLRLFGSLDFLYDEFEPGRSFRVATGRRAAPITHRFEIDAVGDQTRVSHVVTCTPRGPARLATPLLVPAIRRMVADLDVQMRRVLEGLPGGGAQASGAEAEPSAMNSRT